eukprot:scaffold54090_cov56-Phaeocystis_antarctica.AAC.2
MESSVGIFRWEACEDGCWRRREAPVVPPLSPSLEDGWLATTLHNTPRTKARLAGRELPPWRGLQALECLGVIGHERCATASRAFGAEELGERQPERRRRWLRPHRHAHPPARAPSHVAARMRPPAPLPALHPAQHPFHLRG